MRVYSTKWWGYVNIIAPHTKTIAICKHTYTYLPTNNTQTHYRMEYTKRKHKRQRCSRHPESLDEIQGRKNLQRGGGTGNPLLSDCF